MTLAEIKIAALKLMNATYDYIVAENIADYYDDTNLNDYLYKMNDSINRCFDRLLSDNLAPKKVVELADLTTADDGYHITLDLTTITDFYQLDRVIYTYNSYYESDCEYILEGDTLMLESREGDYKLVYTKTMPYIDDTIADTDTIDMQPEILRMIPYFIKGELYEEDDANIAANAMNIFEARLLTLKKKSDVHQTKVADRYGGYYD